ncbi:hypothetical protein SARC_03924 [Sphaeroforma arctica JP610]|uniref:Uncharacterized protein n=1 Tax=Sphaeroforma arctica JP610 TaxID=667725 RepID=A0A0L0G405_9EUKA|nr:hypothetical protein SARC_03924 [Sphaeroforma arctica JP610]KNC83842.1 hypothetical protein SARC_03924 [Sphaeroforma arctica JP610]|eukprot:XP_014157744.1 hypothetical protein SARC_03924 [Sphaeroforma arctica JP610]
MSDNELNADVALLVVLLSICGGLCYYLFAGSATSKSAGKDPKVAKVDLRSHYGDGIKQRAVKIEDLDQTQIQGLMDAGKLSDMQIRRLRALGKL